MQKKLFSKLTKKFLLSASVFAETALYSFSCKLTVVMNSCIILLGGLFIRNYSYLVCNCVFWNSKRKKTYCTWSLFMCVDDALKTKGED